MKARVEKTAPVAGAIGNSRSGARNSFGHSILVSDFDIRICRSALLLALLLACWQFTAVALATTITSDGSAYSSVIARNSIAATDSITSDNQEKQPSQDDNNFPDSTTDLDDTDGGLDDLSAGADTSTRNDQDTPLFSVTRLDAVTLLTPRIVPILLFPVHCFYCLHEHIRERAPPILK